MKLLAPLVLVVVAAGGCSTSEPPSVELNVARVRSNADVPNVVTTANDRVPLVLDIEVFNRSNEQPLLAAPLFSLETSGNVEILGSIQTELFDGGCRADTAVPVGETVGCRLMFEIPRGEWPTALHYQPQATRFSTPVAVCTADRVPCHGSCVDLTTDPEHCGACLAAVPAGSTCQAGEGDCEGADPATCGGACVDLAVSLEHCGGCNQPVPSGTSCVDGVPACPSPDFTLCDDGCHNLESDRDNCGACGRSVGDAFVCVAGEEGCGPGLERCDDACKDLQNDRYNCGGCGIRTASEGSCVDGQNACPSDLPDFCEDILRCYDFSSDAENCGACQRACALGECDGGTRCLVSDTAQGSENCHDVCAEEFPPSFSCVGASIIVDGVEEFFACNQNTGTVVKTCYCADPF